MGALYYVYHGTSGHGYIEPYANIGSMVGPVALKVGGNYPPSQRAIGSNDALHGYGEANAAFVGILRALTKPIGLWLHALYEGRRTPLLAELGPVERGFYALLGIDPSAEQGWRGAAVSMLVFNTVLLLFTYAIPRL